MKADWLSDACKIPDEVMNYLRPIAVRAVEEKHYSPELIADIFGISRSSIYGSAQLCNAFFGLDKIVMANKIFYSTNMVF